MSGGRSSGPGPEGDPMDLYQVFQSSYNKITKSESRPASESYGGTGADIYQPESRFFPFDTSSTKQEKTEAGDSRHWPGVRMAGVAGGGEWGEWRAAMAAE